MPIPSPVFLTGQNLAFDEASETVATRLTEHARTMEQGVYQVAEQFYVAVGYGNANMAMVVGTDGVHPDRFDGERGGGARGAGRSAASQ